MRKEIIAAFAAALVTAAPALPAAAQEFSEIYSPYIPSSMTFCGDKVDLDRTDMYERFDRELTQMAYSHGNSLLLLKRANRYFPIIEPILRRNGIPSDMVYMACIESTLNPTAVSGAKAAGLWQFMPSTGKEYGLEVNEYVDERFHPEKATEAACRYLMNAYNKYGNWESVAASYNGGMGRISRELDSQMEDSAYDLFLNSETSRYMFRLLAMKALMENPEQFGYRLTDDQLYQPYEYELIEVNNPVEDWPTWAKDHGINYLILREHNPWIRARSLPNKTGKSYTVKIPTKKSMSRKSAQRKVYRKEWTDNSKR